AKFYILGVAEPAGKPVKLSGEVATFKYTASVDRDWTAVYSGDAIYAAATSSPVRVALVRAAPVVTLKASPNPAASGATVTFTATVSDTANGLAPTGGVWFYVDHNRIG